MLPFVARRLLWMIPVLLTVVGITFGLMHAVPYGPWDSDPARLALRQHGMDEHTRLALDRHYGLDHPLWRQFTRYVVGDWDEEGRFTCGLICANLGPSYRRRGLTVQEILFGRPEGASIWQSRFGYSIRLATYALLFAALVGVPLGVVSALKQNTWLDRALMLFETLCVSIPNFVIGLLLIVVVLMLQLKFLKLVPRSWSTPQTWVVPVVVLGLGTMGTTARLTRATMLETMRQDYVRTARAKGLSERAVVYEHMLRNALIPVVTMLGPALAQLVAGSFVIEMMFGFPGMGSLYVRAITDGDYSMILGTTTVYALLVVLINLGVDLCYGLLDPRIRVA
jgi:oligopeptide transport system permease protein